MRVAQQKGVVLLAGLALAAGAVWLGLAHGWRQGAALLLGAGLGMSLYHAAFGFTAGFRRLLAERRANGLRAQMLMLMAACLLILPALDVGALGGQPVRGFVFPVGLPLLVGAFLFGIGMQLGGGCASGTLYAAGGGSLRMLVTLFFFVAGATLAAWQSELWAGWASLPPVSLPGLLGTPAALALSLAGLATIWAASAALERRRHGEVERLRWWPGDPLRGPWPLAWGALALALLNFATLWLAGRPWAITAAFPLWGSKVVEALGWDDPAFWAYWEDPTRTEALLRPVTADRTSVMDLGLMLGALLAAALAGAAARQGWRLRGPEVAGSVLGGLLLGIGATMAFGCNISAYVSGIASGSLHGWVWIVPGLLGNWIGLRLRPALGLAPRPPGVAAAAL
jgi:uncharacterized membrane protein YedE/YeeE